MNSRMDKYNNQEEKIPTRSDKNKELYKQIYNAYDDFENLVVPSNSREISLKDLNKEITSRQEYRDKKIYKDITNSNDNNKVVRKERIQEEQKKEAEIYEINLMLDKAVNSKRETESNDVSMSSGDYLKRLKLDNRRTNIEQVKEIYDNIQEEEEEEALMKTANLSLEILSDLKGENDITMVSAPIKNEELPSTEKETDFYSRDFKFSKRDFEDKEYEPAVDEDDEFDDIKPEGRLFFKILLLIFGISLVGVLIYFLITYFNKV